jgi:hypothetical protein
MSRIVVYVAGPFRAPNSWEVEKNVRSAEEASFLLAKHGATPICPHTMFRHFDKALPDEVWLEVSSDLLRRCDAAVFLDGFESSEGCQRELEIVKEMKMPWLRASWGELWSSERRQHLVNTLELMVRR